MHIVHLIVLARCCRVMIATSRMHRNLKRGFLETMFSSGFVSVTLKQVKISRSSLFQITKGIKFFTDPTKFLNKMLFILLQHLTSSSFGSLAAILVIFVEFFYSVCSRKFRIELIATPALTS